MASKVSKYRFAPSPTGYLHLGNARTALMNAVLALAEGGLFLLRYDDTDLERSRPQFAEAIAEDLAWLGILPDETIRQSERIALYDDAFETLRREGLVYPCYETTEELDRRRKRLMARGLPPIYDRSALKMSNGKRTALEQEGRVAHWRFLLPNHDGDPFETRRADIKWDDRILGPQTVDLASLSDPVLRRQDGTYLYTLPSVVDDARSDVTTVLRGADHITNTGVQVALFEAFGFEAPAFGHHNLLLDAAGEGLSKRMGSLSLRDLRSTGYEAPVVAGIALLTGTSGQVRPGSLSELAGFFDPESVSASPSRLSMDELAALNRTVLHEMEYETARPRLADLDADLGPDFWVTVRANLERFPEASDWARVVRGRADRAEQAGDAPFLEEAAALLPEELDRTTWGAWTNALKERTGRKGRGLFMPLRLALTGLDHGPELADLLPLMNRDVVLDRLKG